MTEEIPLEPTTDNSQPTTDNLQPTPTPPDSAPPSPEAMARQSEAMPDNEVTADTATAQRVEPLGPDPISESPPLSEPVQKPNGSVRCTTWCVSRTSMKAKTVSAVKTFKDIPNIGPAMVRDFALLGLKKPQDLKNNDPLELYEKMCRVSGVRQDPCALDTYMAAVDFMNGAPPHPWWHYTKERKKRYPAI